MFQTSDTELMKIIIHLTKSPKRGHIYSCVFGKRNYRVLVRVCVCVFPCLCVYVFLHDNSNRNRSRNTKLEYAVVYKNSSDEFNIELQRIKVTVSVYYFKHLCSTDTNLQNL